MQKNLIPASYEKSTDLAVLVKYLWIDVYKKLAGEEFLKVNCPRIIHVIGSAGYNSDGTREGGVAEGGLKVTLMSVNELDPSKMEGLNAKGYPTGLNDLFFHTMHHEFGHILDQTHLRPSAFNTLSQGLYDNVGWGDKSDSIQAGLGFVTPYASSSQGEDWVEVLSCYITYNQKEWDRLLATAHFDWEEVDMTSTAYDSLFYRYDENGKQLKPRLRQDQVDMDTIGYLRSTNSGESKCIRKVVPRTPEGWVIVDDNGNYTISTNGDNVDGRQVILDKLEMVRSWLHEHWEIDIDKLRQEVQQRQFVTDADGNFIFDARGNYVNRLTYPLNGTSGQTLIDKLRQEVKAYEALQQKK
jgi:substrate import-associated zinc metallohydrolase lipoprotein